MNGSEGITLTVGASALSAIASGLITYWKAKQPRKIEQPVEIRGEMGKRPAYITVQECNRRMCEMREEHSKTEAKLDRVLEKLDEIDSRSESRAIATHDRLDPVIKELSRCIGQADLIKEAFLKATYGGNKQ